MFLFKKICPYHLIPVAKEIFSLFCIAVCPISEPESYSS